MLKAVIFDMDGVLIDSEPVHFESDVHVLKRFHKELTFDYYKKHIGTTMFNIWSSFKEEFALDLSVEELMELADEEKHKIIEESGYPEIKGVANLVKSIAGEKVLLAVASSSPYDYIISAIEAIKVNQYFQEIVSGAQIERPKPSPDIFLQTAELLGVKPEECLVVEDSHNGVKAAKAAGMVCLGFRNPSSGDQDITDADCLIDSFENIDVQFIEQVYEQAINT